MTKILTIFFLGFLNDDVFQKYRDDGKEPLKMYTNPDYFFELWREQIQKEAEAARNQKREKRRRQRIKLEERALKFYNKKYLKNLETC